MTSTPAPPNMPKNCRLAGLGFLLVGAVLCLFTAVSYVRTMGQPAAAERNYELVREHWDTMATDPGKSRQLATALGSSTLQLARTNLRVKLALGATALLLAGAGGLLWFSNKSRP